MLIVLCNSTLILSTFVTANVSPTSTLAYIPSLIFPFGAKVTTCTVEVSPTSTIACIPSSIFPFEVNVNHIFQLLSNHPNLYISFFHDTSNATCKLNLSFLISYTIPHFHSSVHLTKSPKCLKQNKDTS